ncbi:HAD family phosphatase [Parvularcula sp. LCG005]|uniref:HAD family hydrolase n=1 Tax=Parvularcula sp. LCG005 TaxID=3078805 RepID=UPI00294359F0|nr:HAD family phosphatase [Parvularcula sp. LCG005]WOI53493.1 HAD family phosphatase [Parvularcula sp. LCG005]
MSFKAILFDCDGVLVDSEIVGLEDSVRFLNDRGFSLTARDVIRRFTGMRADRFAGEMRAEYDMILGRPSSDDEFDALFEGFVDQRRAKRDEMQAVPGALDIVATLARDFDVALVVASSSGQFFLDSKIDRYGFRPHFGHHVYSADDVSHGKPAPDIFLHSAERAGVSPTECLVIEDSPNGVEAGVAAGATVWGFTGGGHCLEDHHERLAECGAARVYENHGDLLRHLSENLVRRVQRADAQL